MIVDLGADPHGVLGAHEADGRRRRARATGPRRRRCASSRQGVEAELQGPGRALGGAAAEGASCRSSTSSRSSTRTGTRSPSATRTRSCRRSASSTSTSRWRAGTSTSTSGSARTSARSTASPAPRSPSGRRTRARSAVVGDFNSWDGRLHPMRSLGASGHLGAVRPGRRRRDEVQVRDPDAGRPAAPEGRPARVPRRGAAGERVGRLASRSTTGRDEEWLERRAGGDPLRGPMSIYEVHLGSWRRNPLEGNRPLSYRELADELADYVADLGFTHVELLPVMEHPFSGSWGYQVTGYYAPTSRFGTPDDFRYFVDRLHQRGHRRDPRLGARALPARRLGARHASTARTSTSTPTRAAARIPDWGTLVFNFGRTEVRNFLLANALFWLRGAPRRRAARRRRRLDALPRLLAQGRRVGAERVRRPREPRGGRVPQGAERDAVRARGRGSSRRPRSRPRGPASRGRPTSAGSASASSGTWAGCTTRSTYFQKDPVYRQLPPPHADVLAHVRVQRELRPAALARRGRARQAVAARQDARRPLAEVREPPRALRLHVGAPRQEAPLHGRRARASGRSGTTTARSTGTCSSTPSTRASSRSCATSTAPTARTPALWELDFDPAGFRWLEANDAANNVLAFARARRAATRRRSSASCNLSPVPRHDYRVGMPACCRWREVLNTRLGVLRRHRRRATSAASRPRRCRGTTSRSRRR